MGTRIRVWLALAVAGMSLVLAVPALAGPNPDWAAKWEGQSGYPTMESGQTVESQQVARNVGAQTWDRSFVNIGTVTERSASEARNSPFQVVGDWLTENRPGHLDQQTVPPQGIGTFTFRMRAPQVTVKTDFKEFFSPVAEGRSWMGCLDGCQWASVWLLYTVYPPQDPTVSIAAGDRTVTAGDAIDVSANASDNVGLNRVVFSLENQDIVVNTPPYKARFSSAGLDSGSHVVTARAYDNAGHVASDSVTYTVKSSGAGQPQTPPSEGSVPDVGVSINEGQVYTNSPVVRLTLRPPAGATGATISNDGLANPASVSLSGEQIVSWTLASSGPERLPKTVYVHFTGGGVDASKQHTDDIILDQTPPALDRVRVIPQRRGNRKTLAKGNSVVKGRCSRKPLMLKTKAHDNVSGVNRLSYSFNRRKLGTSLAFNPLVRLKLPAKPTLPKAVFVRVRDGAFNLSKVRKISLRNACG